MSLLFLFGCIALTLALFTPPSMQDDQFDLVIKKSSHVKLTSDEYDVSSKAVPIEASPVILTSDEHDVSSKAVQIEPSPVKLTSDKQDEIEEVSPSIEKPEPPKASKAEEKDDVMSIDSYYGLWDHYNCDNFFEGITPIPPAEAWTSGREVYRSMFAYKDISREPDAPIPDDSPNGFSVSVEVKQSPGKGRGIFAAQDIQKGEMIWSSKNSLLFNENGVEYKKFLMAVDPEFVCNVLQCSSMEGRQNRRGAQLEYFISTDMEESCFVNEVSMGESVTMGCDEEAAKDVQGGCPYNDFALHDIKKGDEILMSYGDFAYSWDSFTFDV